MDDTNAATDYDSKSVFSLGRTPVAEQRKSKHILEASSGTEFMYAIGSSYLARQTAGSERLGGVTVKLRPRMSMRGTIEVSATDWRTEENIADNVQFLTDAAIEGIYRFAKENEINLDDWDITLSRFLYHPVDANPHTTRIAAYNAIASALATWQSTYVRMIDT